MSKELTVSCLSEAKISPRAVKQFIEELSKKIEPHGIVMIRDGKKILDINWEPYVTDMPHVVNSVTKTFVGIAIGLIYDRGLVKLEDKVVDIFPEVEYDARNTTLKDVTVKNVMTMSMGQIANPVVDEDRNWVSALFNNPISFEPGSMFHYDSLATYLLSAIVTKKTGESVATLLQRDVFAPMGIDKSYFLENHEGIVIGGLGLFIPTEGLAKTGWMLTNKGEYNGTRILSEEWATMQITKQIDNANVFDISKHESRQGYCLQCWKCCNGGTRMSGLWGQMCLMMPEFNFVMAINARGSSSQPMLDIFDKTVLPALKNSKVYVPDEKEQQEFDEYVSNLAVKVKTNEHVSAMQEVVSGRNHVVKNHPYGIESFKVTFKDEKATLEVVRNGKTYCAVYGHNKLLKGVNNMYDLFPPYYDYLSKPKKELQGFVDPNAYCSYYWEDEGAIHFEGIYDNEATHFNLKLRVDYGYAILEWIPLTIFSHEEHIWAEGKAE